MRLRQLMLFGSMIGACSGSEAVPDAGAPRSPPAAPHEQAAPPDAEAQADRARAPLTGAAQGAPAPGPSTGRVPARGCALRSDTRVAAGAQITLVDGAPLPTALVVEADAKRLSVYAWQGSGFAHVFTHLTGENVTALGALAAERGPALVAWVDVKGGVHTGEIASGGLTHVQTIEKSGADNRFAPALSGDTPSAIAYTRSVDQAMHTFVSVRASGAFAAPFDVTPAGHGAAAPTFLRGRAARALYVIDARAGLSPLLEIPLPAAQAGSVVVRTPVSQPAAPPLLRALSWKSGDVHVLYTAIGKLAASAVGHQLATRAEAPSALVPSFGYGELRFDALVREGSALAALEVPDDVPVTATRHLELVVLDDRGEGPRFKLPTAGATRPSLARGAGDDVWLAYHAGESVHIAQLACGQ